MGRPIETDDEALLEAASGVLMSGGPSRFTLAKAAEAAGVSAATLIKRFGSKERLFLRLSQRWVASLDEDLSEATSTHDSPLDRARIVALHNYRGLDQPDTAHHQLAVLAIDLQNDAMRSWLHVGWGHVQRHLARHLDDAITAGELNTGTPPAQLARIIVGAMEGGCLIWSVHPEGSLVNRLCDDFNAIVREHSPRTLEGS